MADKSRIIDWGGLDLIARSLRLADKPGQAGTASTISATELGFLDGVTAGTAAASKALVLNSSSAITTGLSALTATAITVTTLTPTTIAGTPSFSGAPTFATTSTFTGVATFNANPTFGAGKTLDLDSNTATLSSNAATLTKYACVVTSESLTTSAGSSQAFTLTLSGVAAGDLAFVTKAGGTNTRKNFQLEAVTTTNTITVTLYNTEPSNAINGTVIFNIWVLKA